MTLDFFKTLDGSLAYFRTGTLILITSLASTSQYYVLWPWYAETRDKPGLLHLVLFNIGILFIYWTLYLACQDPGKVNADFVPVNDAQMRYCKQCQVFKPPRTHHCKSCGRCILRMDHHCPWLSSCVGYYNHAAFIKFLCWVVPTTGYLATMMGIKLYELLISEGTSELDVTLLIMTCFNLIAASAVCLMVLCLMVYQIWCICENITTIESWNKNRIEDLIRRKKIPPVEFPYDLYSITDNLKEIMGHCSPVVWLWPPQRVSGSGHEFPVNEYSDLNAVWPPPESQLAQAIVVSNGASAHSSRSPTEPDTTYWDDESCSDAVSNTDDDYVDGEGEYLDSYGVDDTLEITKFDDIVHEDLTLGSLLARKRKIWKNSTQGQQSGKGKLP